MYDVKMHESFESTILRATNDINCHWQARPGPVSQDPGAPAVIQLWNTSFIADSR